MILISDFNYSSTVAARGVLDCDLVVDLEKGYRGSHRFYSDDLGMFATLDDDIFTLKKSYRCDLCSPAIRIRDRWVGTRTTRREALGAFLHDATRTLINVPCSPWDRKASDDVFWDALELGGSRFKRTYHFAVSSLFGTIFIGFTAKKNTCQCLNH